MLLETHAKLMGAVLVIGGIFLAYGVAQAIGGSYARTLGCATAGVLIGVIDVTVRRKWGEGDGWRRYLVPARGPNVGFIPAWAAGLAFLLVAIGVAGS